MASLMEKLHYTEASQLKNYFFGRILSFVCKNNKQAVLWLELDNPWIPANEYLFDYSDDVVLVTWRNGLVPLLNLHPGKRIITLQFIFCCFLAENEL